MLRKGGHREEGRQRPGGELSEKAASCHPTSSFGVTVDDLPAVMGFVRHEVGEDVSDIEREIAPGIGGGGRDAAASVTAQGEQTQDAPAASAQGGRQDPAAHAMPIDAARSRDAELIAQGLDPAAPGVVKVGRHHADAAPGSAGDGALPQLERDMLDQENGQPVAGPPRVQDRFPEVGRHGR
jgi:hypothetical protein